MLCVVFVWSYGLTIYSSMFYNLVTWSFTIYSEEQIRCIQMKNVFLHFWKFRWLEDRVSRKHIILRYSFYYGKLMFWESNKDNIFLSTTEFLCVLDSNSPKLFRWKPESTDFLKVIALIFFSLVKSCFHIFCATNISALLSSD